MSKEKLHYLYFLSYFLKPKSRIYSELTKKKKKKKKKKKTTYSTKEIKGIKINLYFIFNNFCVHRTGLRLVIITNETQRKEHLILQIIYNEFLF